MTTGTGIPSYVGQQRAVNVKFLVGGLIAEATMHPNEGEQVIYRMTITVKGKVIRRPNGKPFRIVLRTKKTVP
ncbi:hypothetical protein [Kerstersia sp.]|uniref:hypothetical protein n=1 Tax=Kerstersia sp. TaxID=1930783 RepID=UPI003F8E0DCD